MKPRPFWLSALTILLFATGPLAAQGPAPRNAHALAEKIDAMLAQRWLKDGRRTGMCSQEACGEKIIELVPEQRIQRRTAFNRIRCAYEQTGCDGIGMPRSFQQLARRRHVGFTSNALERPVGKIELKDVDGPGNVPAGA